MAPPPYALVLNSIQIETQSACGTGVHEMDPLLGIEVGLPHPAKCSGQAVNNFCVQGFGIDLERER